MIQLQQKTTSHNVLRVGFTEAHGMARELSEFPPPGVEYAFLRPVGPTPRMIQSPIKGYLRQFEAEDNDLVEAVLSPVLTKSPWIYSLANFIEANAFSLFGFPTPRSARVAYLKSLLLKDNFKKLIFWSEAGKETLRTYASVRDERLLRKATVVYPAHREVPNDLINYSNGDLRILFSGDFFRKGGVNVVDAFERAQRHYPGIKLRLCCDEHIDFKTRDIALRAEYLEKIRRNPAITLGRAPRNVIINEILPETDIYLMPTYVEAFGFAVLEAMAFGIPVVSTNYFAIPEMVEHDVCGYLIETHQFNCDALFRGYVVNHLPRDFRDHVTEGLNHYLAKLIESLELRKTLGTAGVKIAREKFSFKVRNTRMLEIYQETLS